MREIAAAIDARVSSEQQAAAHTIARQVAALRERVTLDGLVRPAAMVVLDEGDSGATVVRPARERRREVSAAGAIDRLYVHSPDRLARTYAYPGLLVDACQRMGGAVVF
jgi:site-specific DNA recombinase